MRLVTVLILLSLLLVVNLSAESMTWFLIENSFSSWTLAKLVPAILTIIGSVLLGFQLFKLLKTTKVFKVMASILIPSLLMISFLVNNKPYLEDYAKAGIDITHIDNSILKEHLETFPNYNGLLVVASSTCPHCMSSAQKLGILKNRIPDRNVDMYLFTTKDEVIQEFKEETSSENLRYHTVHDEDAALNLCDGRFPAFIYIKNGVLVKRWFNDDFGYPAYDWVESGLE